MQYLYTVRLKEDFKIIREASYIRPIQAIKYMAIWSDDERWNAPHTFQMEEKYIKRSLQKYDSWNQVGLGDKPIKDGWIITRRPYVKGI